MALAYQRNLSVAEKETLRELNYLVDERVYNESDVLKHKNRLADLKNRLEEISAKVENLKSEKSK